MGKLFLTVLNMSLTGAFVIAAIIVARFPLKKAPKIISYSLWAVAGYRLIWPLSFESLFSLLPFKAQPIPADIATQAVPRIDSGIPFVNNALSSVLPAATPAASVNPLQIWITVGTYAWLIGVAAMLLYGFVSYALLKRSMRTAIRIEENIYETDGICSPFVLGIMKPKIYLPLTLAAGEREYIILHERTHIRRYDHIVKCAAYFILCLHWFNPLAWAAFLLMGVDMEMSCDERVLKEMGGETKHDYSRSLLSLATQRRVIGSSPLAFGEGGIKERVKNVLNFKKPSQVLIVAAVALTAVLSVGFAVNKAETNSLIEFEVISTPLQLTNTISIIVWKDTDNKACYSLFDGDVAPAPSELSSGRVFNDIAELNAALSIYPQDMLSMVHVDHTLDFTKEEMISITEQFIIPSGNYSMATGGYAFHITTFEEARGIVGEHYPGWPDIAFVGEDTISYTNPPMPVEVYKFEVIVSGLVETCAVSKERGIFFNYSNGTWAALTGLAEWTGETQNMTLDDVRAIAQKIGPDLTMGDLRDFIGTDVGSGLFIMQYAIENSDYMLIVGSGDMNTVMYADLIHVTEGGENASIDIRYYDVDRFIENEMKELVHPLPEPQETTPPASTDLETAISQAILDENKNGYNPGDFSTEAHTTLTIVEEGNTVTAYLMVLYQRYVYQGGGFSELGGSHMPVAITFDKQADGGYSMTEYWVPRDGSYYIPSIKDKFPANIYEAALDTQMYIYANKMACYEQAIQYGAVDTDKQIALLLDTIGSSPAQASDPGAYIEAHPIEYRELVYYGRNTLDYCFELFGQGGQTGLNGHIMAAVCSDIMPILGETVAGGQFNTGQDWYDAQRRRIIQQ